DVTGLQTADDFYERAVLDAGLDFDLAHLAIVYAAGDGAVAIRRDGGERQRERRLLLDDDLCGAVHAGAGSALLVDVDSHEAEAAHRIDRRGNEADDAFDRLATAGNLHDHPLARFYLADIGPGKIGHELQFAFAD